MGILVIFSGFGRRKTKPIYLYCVLRGAYCVMVLFAKGKNDVKSLLTMIYGDFGVLRRRKNKPNSKPNKANRRPLAGNPKQARMEDFIVGLLKGNLV